MHLTDSTKSLYCLDGCLSVWCFIIIPETRLLFIQLILSPSLYLDLYISHSRLISYPPPLNSYSLPFLLLLFSFVFVPLSFSSIFLLHASPTLSFPYSVLLSVLSPLCLCVWLLAPPRLTLLTIFSHPLFPSPSPLLQLSITPPTSSFSLCPYSSPSLP